MSEREVMELESDTKEQLAKKLGIMEEDVLIEHEDFVEKYPEGFMTKPEFLARCMKKYDTTEEQAEAVFNVFDVDQSGTVDFAEFMMASHATTLRLVKVHFSRSSCPLHSCHLYRPSIKL